jgi:hypothetical protein
LRFANCVRYCGGKLFSDIDQLLIFWIDKVTNLLNHPKGTYKGLFQLILQVGRRFGSYRKLADQYGCGLLKMSPPGGYFVDSKNDSKLWE